MNTGVLQQQLSWILAKASELVYDETSDLEPNALLGESRRWLLAAERLVRRGDVTSLTEALPAILRAVFTAGQAKGLE